MAFSPDGTVLAADLSGLSSLTLWDAQTGRRIAELKHSGLTGMAFGPDSKIVATSGRDGKIRLWDIASKAVVRARELPAIIPGVPNFLSACAYSPDGRTLAVSQMFGGVVLVDAPTLATREILSGERNYTRRASLHFSSNGACLAEGNREGKVHIWDCLTGEMIRIQAGHEGEIACVRFGPDGRTLFTTSAKDRTALLWDLKPPSLPAFTRASWDDLLSDDAAKVYAAQWTIMEDSEAAAAFLAEELPPSTEKLDRQAALKFIADLDSPKFRVREDAAKVLAEMDGPAVPLLREAKPKSPEQKERIERILKLVSPDRSKLAPGQLRILRVVQALEQAGTPETRALLATWCRGMEGTFQTETAKDAMRRLERTDGPRR